MGCGASGELTPAKYEPPSGRRSDAEDHDDARKVKRKSKGKKEKEKFNEHADVIWHQKNCMHGHLSQCMTIAEAYPFDESNRKTVSKNESIMTGGERLAQDKSQSRWGAANVHKLGPARILCDVCGIFILDREMRTPFYVCVNCRSHGRKLEVCVKCYHDRAAEKPPEELRKSGGGGKPQKKEKVPEKGALPDGIWTATIHEQRSTRTVLYKLNFTGKGQVTGEGPEKCSVKGTLDSKKIEWTETHVWGTLNVTADFTPGGRRPTISGTFEASDDGSGTIEFVYNPADNDNLRVTDIS